MKARTLMLALALWFVGAAVCYAEDPHIGTWKLNEAKSHIPAGASKIATAVYQAEGDNIKVTLDGTGRDGKPLHSEWTGKFDGKDYPVTGDSSIDSRAYTKVNSHTLTAITMKDSKEVSSSRAVVSADGKTRTVDINAIDKNGKKIKAHAVFDKQ